MENLKWQKLNGNYLCLPLREEITQLLIKEHAQGNEIKVCIGTDSQVEKRQTKFATAIVFLRKGKGGFMYIHKEITQQKMALKQRMMEEVTRSVQVTFSLTDIFQAFDVQMEVHADINNSPVFKSNDALKEAMGYITGMGFKFKAKPDAFASSNCADKVVHG